MNDQERKRGHEEKGISVVVTLAKNENSRKILSGRGKNYPKENRMTVYQILKL